MMLPKSLPPAQATRILASLLPEFSREAILGDLQENFAEIEEVRGKAAASRWYWNECLAALPSFAIYSLQSAQIRRQIVNGNIWNENWFGKQNSRLIAGIGFLFLLPALLTLSMALLIAFFGKPMEASLNSIPGGAQFIIWLYDGSGPLGIPIGLIILGGLFLGLLINFLAVVHIKIESGKDAYRAIFTIRRKSWNLILLGLVVLLGVGMDWLIG
jgi:hypothetical protein